jgi:hypothetical protein
MGIFSGKTTVDDDERESEYQRLLNEMAQLRAEVRALREERQGHKSAIDLERQISKLQIDKDRLEEENARKLREATQDAEMKVQAATHEAGLLLKEREFDVESARREAVLTVREGNLEAEQKRFEKDMAFQREHMQREVDRFDGIAKSLMERLPTIEVNLEASAQPATRSRAKAD